MEFDRAVWLEHEEVGRVSEVLRELEGNRFEAEVKDFACGLECAEVVAVRGLGLVHLPGLESPQCEQCVRSHPLMPRLLKMRKAS